MHFDEDTLRCFVSGELSSETTRDVAGHLLRGCERCQELAQRYWYPHGNAVAQSLSADRAPAQSATRTEGVDWPSLAQRLSSREAEVELERESALVAADRLVAKPLGSRLMMIRNSPYYRTWAITEELLARAWSLRFDDVQGLIETSQTALACAESVDLERYSAQAVHDLRSRCWSHIGTGFGILHDFAEAETCHENARLELEKGSGDPLELASWLKLQVGLRLRQKAFDVAESLTERLLAIVRRAGTEHAVGEAKNLLGVVRANQGRVNEAIQLFDESIRLLDPEIDARFLANSLHGLVAMLDESGRQDEALERLADLRTHYENLGDRLSLLRLTVAEGEIAAKMNNLMLAERCFLTARNGFVESRLSVEAAEATLELALIYLRNGRFAETRRVAEQMAPVFRSKGLEREALAALLIFREAALRETVSVALVSETLKLVRSIQHTADKQRTSS